MLSTIAFSKPFDLVGKCNYIAGSDVSGDAVFHTFGVGCHNWGSVRYRFQYSVRKSFLERIRNTLP